MLWKKESNRKNAMYVDMFVLSGQKQLIVRNFNVLSDNKRPIRRKSDEVSLQKRKEGNILFFEQDWTGAMEMYNLSLCFAERRSKTISLAFANRAACFLKLKLYDECLVDIELAKKSGYPEYLMTKLNQRKTECLNGIAANKHQLNQFGLKLDFDSDEKYPFMANVLEIAKDSNDDFSVITTENLKVGQTVVVEEAFLKYLFVRHGWKCNICLKSNANLVPCKKCTIAMFCYNKCGGNVLHELECGIKLCNDSQTNGVVLQDVRGILLAINMFSTADDMIYFVEQTLKSDHTFQPLPDARSKYRAFLQLPIQGRNVDQEEQFVATVFCVYKLILDIPKINAMFESKKHRRFLVHLIGQHVKIATYNTLHVTSDLFDLKMEEQIELYSQTGLISRYFRHSCAPNVLRADRDGNSVYITVRPIAKNGQLLVSNSIDLFDSKEKRQEYLWTQKQIICDCLRCEGVTASEAQRQLIRTDANFLFILSNRFTLKLEGSEMVQTMIKKCVKFLNQYGKLKWCDEIATVVDVYMMLLGIQLVCSMD